MKMGTCICAVRLGGLPIQCPGMAKSLAMPLLVVFMSSLFLALLQNISSKEQYVCIFFARTLIERTPKNHLVNSHFIICDQLRDVLEIYEVEKATDC